MSLSEGNKRGCAVKLQEYAKAAADVNKIRERAGCMDLFDVGELNGLDGLDVIMDERARELMYEEFKHPASNKMSVS